MGYPIDGGPGRGYAREEQADSMKAVVVALAEAAVPHEDGTFSLLKGGLRRVWAEGPETRIPVEFRGTLVARVEGTPSERGPHTVTVLCRPAGDRETVLFTEDGEATLTAAANGAHVFVPFQLELPRLGTYEFLLRVDGRDEDAWRFDAVPEPEGHTESS